MSKEGVRQVVYTQLIAGMGAYDASIVVKTQNNKFVQPDTPWVDVHIYDALESYRRSLGLRYRVESLGYIAIDVQVPEDTGMVDMNNIQDALEDTLGGRQFPILPSGSITFRDGIYKKGRTVDGFHTSTAIFYYNKTICRDIS